MFSVRQSTELVITPARCDNKIHDDFAFSACPLLFFLNSPPSSIPPKKPNQQYFHKTWLRPMNITLSVKADQLYRRTAFKRSRKLIWAAEQGWGGAERNWAGGERSTDSPGCFHLLIDSFILEHRFMNGVSRRPALPFLSFTNLCQSGKLLHRGKWGLTASPETSCREMM